MKRLILSVLVLCVVAPASFGADEYTWKGGSQDWSTGTWELKIDSNYKTKLGWTAPVAPYETQFYSTGVVQARPQITDGSAITVTTDIAPLDTGFQQMQIAKGTVTVDAGGELRIAGGYIHMSTNSQASGMIVQNGGKYINIATMSSPSDSQRGTLLTYTTLNSKGFVTISGQNTLFDTKILFGGRSSGTAVRSGQVNVLGSGSTINTEMVGPGGNNLTMTYNFTTDAGGVSAINVGTSLAFQQGVNPLYTSNKSILDFVLGACPESSYVLFNLAEGATRTGKLQLVNDRVLQEKHLLRTLWEGCEFFYEITYVGGDTGNDVVLTCVPEPATLGLLGLGGLVLARRRRA